MVLSLPRVTIKGKISTLSKLNYPHLDNDCPLATSYWVYVSHFIIFARDFTNVEDVNERKAFNHYKSSMQTLLQRGIAFLWKQFYGEDSQNKGR